MTLNPLQSSVLPPSSSDAEVLRVATYNIHGAIGGENLADLQIADCLELEL